MTGLYPYATGDLIESPNTYFYSAFSGRQFVEAWRWERQKLKASLPPPVEPPPATPANDDSRAAVDLLERAFAGDDELREAFLIKFEITKRVHGGYDHRFRAVDRKDCRDMSRYMRAADVFETAYSERASLRYLNVLLKCLDTLCARKNDLGGDLPSRLAWHLIREKKHFDALSADAG